MDGGWVGGKREIHVCIWSCDLENEGDVYMLVDVAGE